jgi:hypothetical protein
MKKGAKKGKKGFVIVAHPFLAAVYPVIFLFAHNIKETFVGNITGPLIVSCLAAAALFFGLAFFLKDKFKAGIITTASALAFLSYGSFYRLLEDIEIGDFQVFNHAVLMPLTIILACLAVDALIRTEKFREINFILNIVAGLMTALVAGQAVYGMAVYHRAVYNDLNRRIDKTALAARKSNPDVSKYPDIYYIILDGHARQDVLKDLYGYDDSGFINKLGSMGFYVAGRARSNYCQTLLSLSSTLNMEYMDDASRKGHDANATRIYLVNMMRRNRVFTFLKEHGYTTVSYFTGYEGTDLKRQVDVYLPNEQVFPADMNEFNAMFVNSTMIAGLWKLLDIKQKNKFGPEIANLHRTQYKLEHLADSAGIASPKIVFCHIIAPHPPFVFDENGPSDRFVDPSNQVILADGSDIKLSKSDYRTAYARQARYIDGRIADALGKLMGATKGRAVIILQADHGPGMGLDWKSFEKTDLKERFSILDAYYLPGGIKSLFYDTITPVNTFRLILGRYFGADLPVLPDKSYYSTWAEPFKFIRVSEEAK